MDFPEPILLPLLPLLPSNHLFSDNGNGHVFLIFFVSQKIKKYILPKPLSSFKAAAMSKIGGLQHFGFVNPPKGLWVLSPIVQRQLLDPVGYFFKVLSCHLQRYHDACAIITVPVCQARLC